MSARRVLAALALVVGALSGTGRAAPLAPAPPPTRELEAAHAAQAEAARRYRESLDTLLPLQVAALQRAAAEVEQQRALHSRGFVATLDVDVAERALAGAREMAEHTRAAISAADALVAEADAAREMAAQPPPALGQTHEGPTLIRHAGRGRWSLAVMPALERFYTGRFGQPLPVSALGLRANGIPFLAFRAASPGVATGAHVHIGEPSARLQGGNPTEWRASY
ncbi:MAG TPA: hypothetical protein VFV05_22990 [Methylomirabilota bacterium]|nr:hypothetical protein [Methylomirabilota bacterium]